MVRTRAGAVNIANIETRKEGSQAQTPSVEGLVTLIREQIDPLKKELTDYKANLIEVLAIFVALFTFVSFDVQIFKANLSVFSVLGFTLIMLGSLTFFLILLKTVLSGQRNITLLTVSIIFISLGILSIAFSYSLEEKKESNSFNLVNSNLINLKNCLYKYQWVNPKCFEDK